MEAWEETAEHFRTSVVGLAMARKDTLKENSYLLWKPNSDRSWHTENCTDKQNCWKNKFKVSDHEMAKYLK